MKKQTFLLFLLIGIKGISQVGVNTVTPLATLDVVAKTTDGSRAEGIAAPRLTGDQVKAGDLQYGTSQKGVIVYCTSAVGVASPKTANITREGYYYFDGAIWQKIINGNDSSSAPATNIYTNNGTLTGNRIVTQNSNTLAFTGTAQNAFSVAGDTFSVDAATSRIGLGTTAPSVKLDVQGSQLLNAAITGATTKNALDINIGLDNYGYGNRLDNYGINMKTSSSSLGGNIARINFGDISTAANGNNGTRYLSFSVGRTLTELMYLTDANSGRVGIGTSDPLARLHVDGGESRFSNTTSIWALTPSTGGTAGASNSLEIIDRVNNKRRMVFNDNGDVSLGGIVQANNDQGVISIRGTKVGIGLSGVNSIPVATLDVQGTVSVNGASTNASSYVAGTNTNIDFSKSNLAYSNLNPGSNFTLQNVKDGGTYTLLVQGTTSGTASFSASGFTVKSMNNGPTTAGKQTLYTFIVIGTNVYASMATGF